MKKETGIIAALAIFLAVVLLLGFLNYKNLSSKISTLEQKNSNLVAEGESLKNEISQLNSQISSLNQEKSGLTSERESLRADVARISSSLSMMQEDITKIRKGCINENVCKGHVSGIRYRCNIQGDAVDNGDRICECDDNCEVIIS